MMGDKCAELVRAAMIGALAVTLSNPTAVYAAEEETADPGQIGIEIAGEAAVGAASFDVEENVAEPEEPQPDGTEDMPETQPDETKDEKGSEKKKMRQTRRNRRIRTAERMRGRQNRARRIRESWKIQIQKTIRICRKHQVRRETKMCQKQKVMKVLRKSRETVK